MTFSGTLIFSVLAGNKETHTSLDEFEFLTDQIWENGGSKVAGNKVKK